jgi:hypothetical protein
MFSSLWFAVRTPLRRVNSAIKGAVLSRNGEHRSMPRRRWRGRVLLGGCRIVRCARCVRPPISLPRMGYCWPAARARPLTLAFAGALNGVIAPTIGHVGECTAQHGHCSGIFRQLMFCDKSRRGEHPAPVLAALRSVSIREAEKILLVDRLQNVHDRLLDDLFLQIATSLVPRIRFGQRLRMQAGLCRPVPAGAPPHNGRISNMFG